METAVKLLDHTDGAAHGGTFRLVRAIGPDCLAGVTELDLGAHGQFFVPTIIRPRSGGVFAYHDWQAAYPEEIALAPADHGTWYDNATDTRAVFVGETPYSVG